MTNQTAHRAFSLLELLVSIAIIAIVTGLSIAGYGKFTAHAQNMRCVEFVHQTKTALEHLYQRDDAWPPLLQKEASGEGGNINLLILHAEDQLMSAEGFKTIALEFIEVYKRFDAEKEA